MIFSINTCLSFSQYTWTDGEIILKNGEIIVGEIKIPMVSKDLVHFNGKSKVRVKNKLNGDRTVFDENQVELIKFKYSESEIAYYKYIPVSKKKKEIFCIVTTGPVTLYGRAVGMTSSNPGIISFHSLNEFYAQRLGEEIATPLKTARPSKSLRKRAIEYFNDCPAIVYKLKSNKPSTDEIIAIVEEYNQCAK
ncbi:hypothetical protein SAMN05421766_10244 [Zobellia uliginosa]|uniref:Uncharacterized protein n=2 Tax=Zobellia uliginosa TaxID=143224 RepID=A0ABY1KKY7_9FLAO|nr:hypothetical protein SAMN05421766_10244 [Zobellia uliginosa]